jgi:hypothetical protein
VQWPKRGNVPACLNNKKWRAERKIKAVIARLPQMVAGEDRNGGVRLEGEHIFWLGFRADKAVCCGALLAHQLS